MRDSFIDAIGGSDADAADTNDKATEGSAGAWQQADAHLGTDVNKAISADMRKELQADANKVDATDSQSRKPASVAADSNLEIFEGLAQ